MFQTPLRQSDSRSCFRVPEVVFGFQKLFSDSRTCFWIQEVVFEFQKWFSDSRSCFRFPEIVFLIQNFCFRIPEVVFVFQKLFSDSRTGFWIPEVAFRFQKLFWTILHPCIFQRDIDRALVYAEQCSIRLHDINISDSTADPNLLFWYSL